MPELQIVIAANGEKTLKSLVKAYLDFYQKLIECRIYIYDSKYSKEVRDDLLNIENVEYIQETNGPLYKYFRHVRHFQI